MKVVLGATMRMRPAEGDQSGPVRITKMGGRYRAKGLAFAPTITLKTPDGLERIDGFGPLSNKTRTFSWRQPDPVLMIFSVSR